MSLVKKGKCSRCGKEFYWRIQRPSDGYWDRWKSDEGDTLTRWFMNHTLCWDHAFEEMPEKFRKIIRTITYEEEEKKISSG